MVTNGYVDAFNLYHGCLKGTAYKWLDPGRLCHLLAPFAAAPEYLRKRSRTVTPSEPWS